MTKIKQKLKKRLSAIVILACVHAIIFYVSQSVAAHYYQLDESIPNGIYYAVLTCSLACLVLASINFVSAFWPDK